MRKAMALVAYDARKDDVPQCDSDNVPVATNLVAAEAAVHIVSECPRSSNTDRRQRDSPERS